MTRAELRRQARAERKKQNVYHMTQEQLDRDNLVRDISTMNVTMASTVALMLMSLRDVYGFGQVRINRLMDNFMLKYECLVDDLKDHSLVQSEKFDFYSIIKQVKAETGYDLIGLLQRDGDGNIQLKIRESR